MLGPRQQQIVDALAAGSFSISALLRHLGAREPVDAGRGLNDGR
jgi:hypothetical protein